MAEAGTGTGTGGAQANTGNPTSAANNSGTGGDNNRAPFYSFLSYPSFYICIVVVIQFIFCY